LRARGDIRSAVLEHNVQRWWCQEFSGEITKSSQRNQSVLRVAVAPAGALRGIPFVSRFVVNENGEEILPDVSRVLAGTTLQF